MSFAASEKSSGMCVLSDWEKLEPLMIFLGAE